MNLYLTAPHTPFLLSLADFILERFKDITKVKVILPNGSACVSLQHLLTERQGIGFLPAVIPFTDITIESEEAFRTPSRDIESVSGLEEKIFLAEIIYKYKKLQFNILQSLKFSSQLAKLFYEFGCNNIGIKAIKQLPLLHQAEHWHNIYEFLEYACRHWHEKVASLQKLDRASYQASNLAMEIQRIKHDPTSIVLVAGMFGHDALSWNFLNDLANLPSGFIILPPLPDIATQAVKNSRSGPEDALYCLKKLLKTLGKELSDFKPLTRNNYKPSPLDALILPELIIDSEPFNSLPKPKIDYLEFEEGFQEAEAISMICWQYSEMNKKVAILVYNDRIKDLYIHSLSKYPLKWHDLSGINLASTAASHLLIAISAVIYDEFELQKLFVLLKNPLLHSNLTDRLEQLLLDNRSVCSWRQITETVNQNNDQELTDWWHKLSSSLSSDRFVSQREFNLLLKQAVEVAETICPSIWSQGSNGAVADFFAELINLDWHFTFQEPGEFVEALKVLISAARFFNSPTRDGNITICRPEDAALMKFDLVILADFSEGNYPVSPPVNPWLNQQMQDDLQFCSKQVYLSLSLYNFYLLLHNPEIIITRSKKQGSNTVFLPCSYLLKLQMFLKQNLRSFNKVRIELLADADDTDYIVQASALEEGSSASAPDAESLSIGFSTNFPSTLSVTSIEMLLRSPYSFYAKKILRLRKQQSIAAPPALSEFGSLLHFIMDKYCKSYSEGQYNRLEHFLNITSEALTSAPTLPYVKKAWQIKLAALAEEFIEFDEARRMKLTKVHSEIAGAIILKPAGQEITITAIADRIELDRDGNAAIIDYKTGAIPLENEIRAGLSPQLLLEAIMLLEGGFGITADKIEELVYIKFASSRPYIRTTAIPVNKDELQRHKQGLIRLLERYINTRRFSAQIDLLRYNDYRHLARLQNSSS